MTWPKKTGRKPGRPPWTEQQWNEYNERQKAVQAAGDEYDSKRGMGRREFLKKAGQISVIAGIGALAGGALSAVASPVAPNKSWNLTATIDGTGYLVSIDDSGNFIARNGSNGKIDKSDTDAATTMGFALTNA